MWTAPDDCPLSLDGVYAIVMLVPLAMRSLARLLGAHRVTRLWYPSQFPEEEGLTILQEGLLRRYVVPPTPLTEDTRATLIQEFDDQRVVRIAWIGQCSLSRSTIIE